MAFACLFLLVRGEMKASLTMFCRRSDASVAVRFRRFIRTRCVEEDVTKREVI